MQNLDLPDPGKNRWWDVSLVHNVNVATKPIKVTLMELQQEGFSRAYSSALGFARTVAQPEEVILAAQKVLAEVGRYADVIGQYPVSETKEEAK